MSIVTKNYHMKYRGSTVMHELILGPSLGTCKCECITEITLDIYLRFQSIVLSKCLKSRQNENVDELYRILQLFWLLWNFVLQRSSWEMDKFTQSYIYRDARSIANQGDRRRDVGVGRPRHVHELQHPRRGLYEGWQGQDQLANILQDGRGR